MNRHENAAVSHRHQFERRAQKMPMARSINPAWRKRDIIGGALTCIAFITALVGLLIIGGN